MLAATQGGGEERIRHPRVMKWAKQFLLLQNPEWSKFYVDYSGLMKLVVTAPITAFKAELLSQLQVVETHFKQQFEACNHSISLITAPKLAVAASQRVENLRDYMSVNRRSIRKVLKHGKRMLQADPAPERAEALEELAARLERSALRTLPGFDTLQERLQAAVRRFPPLRRHRSGPRGRLLSALAPAVPTVEQLHLDSFPAGTVTCVRVSLGSTALGEALAVPVMVARGRTAGPVLGLTSALHGNEFNGVPLIHALFHDLDCRRLAGTVVAVVVANPPGFRRHQREFSDGCDLNRVMPGNAHGNCSQRFAHKLMSRVVGRLQLLLDLHTASVGRVNSLYVRADMTHPLSFRLARLLSPQIIVHNTGPDGSLRGAAMDRGITAVTVEIGNPQRFHAAFVQRALSGVSRVMEFLQMLQPEGGVGPTLAPEHLLTSSSSHGDSSSEDEEGSSSEGEEGSSSSDEGEVAVARHLSATKVWSQAELLQASPSEASMVVTLARGGGGSRRRAGKQSDMPGAVREGCSLQYGDSGSGHEEAKGETAVPTPQDILATKEEPQVVAAGQVSPLPASDQLPTEVLAAPAAGSGDVIGVPPRKDSPELVSGTRVVSLPQAETLPVLKSEIAGLLGEPEVHPPAIVCSRSYWMFAKKGGILYVFPQVATWVKRNEVIAEVTDVFGRLLQRYVSPEDGIVVGKSVNPVCASGDRILHLGVVSTSFPEHVDDGHA